MLYKNTKQFNNLYNMKTKIKLNISKKLWLGFGILMFCFAINSILILMTLSNNSELIQKNTEIYMPSVKYLNDMHFLLNDSKMLIKNWAFIDKQDDTPGKLELTRLHATDFFAAKEKISELSNNWTKEEQSLFNNLCKGIEDTLFKKHKYIMDRLNTFESYDELMNAFEVYPLVEDGGEIIILTNNILGRLNNLIKDCEKNVETANQNIEASAASFRIYVIIMGIFILLICIIAASAMISLLVKPINFIKEIILSMGKGLLPNEKIVARSSDEIGEMLKAINLLVESLKTTSQFSLEIGKGNFTHEFAPLSEKDILGNSLITMRNNLQIANEIEEKRKKEDEKRNWATEGMAIFGEILRSTNDDLKKLSEQIINKLVKYINANQGSLFIISNNEFDEKILELFSCYAWDRKKYVTKKIALGEGLVGQVWQEGETILMTDIPNDYINITSGLGNANPSHLIIVPLKVNDEIFGVIELASLKTIEPYQKDFLEKLGESIASTISSVKINLKTVELLTTSQQQTGILLQQEEEMRQNLEELHTTQDEMTKREAEITGIVKAIDNTIAKAELQLNGSIINLNEKFNKVFEIEKANLISQNIKKFIYENQYDIFDDNFKIVSTGISSDFTIKVRTSKNNDKWLLCSLTPVLDSNTQIDKVLFMANDITQQKNLEDELAKKDELQKQEIERLNHENNQKLEELNATQEESLKRETELAAVLNGINQSLGTYEFDINAKITTVNQKFIEQSGINENNFIGESIINFMPQGKHKAMNELIKKLFVGEKHSGAHQFKFNNEEKWFYESYSPVLGLNSKYSKVIVLSFEITNSVLQEKKLKEQSEELIATEEELRQNLEEMHSIQDKIIKDAEAQKKNDELLIKQAKEEAQIHLLNMEEDFYIKQKEIKKKLKEATLELEAAKNN